MSSSLDGKIALVTGAGGGIGRQYALALADEGARVVVNDLGTDRHGEGETTNLADTVVDEIADAGGTAVADYGSVADADDAEAMVDRAYDEFGGLDIVINNAGILRDKTLVNMDEEMWDQVMDVHLKGTFLVSRHAVRRMTDAGTEGRLINTTSYAGLKGNFGQTNYGAAKAGIAGFTRSLALEGQKYKVEVNAIAPIAKTRMTDDIDMVPEQYEPGDIVPLVLWLVSDDAAGVTGRIFGAHGNHYFEYNQETTPGVERDERWTIEDVGERFDDITEKASSGTDAEGGGQVRELFAMLPEVYDADSAGDWSATIAFVVEGTGTYGVEAADGKATFVDGAPDNPDGEVTFDSAETILDMAAGDLSPEKAFMGGKISADNMSLLMKFGDYFDLEAAGEMAAGKVSDDDADDDVDTGPGPNPEAVGNKFKPSARFIKPEQMVAYAEAVDDTNPRYVGDDGNSPDVGAPLLAVRPMFEALEDALSDKQLDADLINLVHGQQEMTLYDVIRPWDLLAPRAEIASIEEKSSGWLVDVDQWLMRDGEKVAEATSGLYIRNPEAEGSSSRDNGADQDADRGEPIYTEEQVVADDQPIRYAKASGDMNPIHTDPDVAKAAGLPDIILHGLCTMAFGARAVVDGVLDGDVERLGRIKVRFAKPVLPGTELRTRIWEGDDADFQFDMVDDDGNEVLTMGEVDERSQ